MQWFVEIIEKGTERVERRLGPMDAKKSERVANGLRTNLNHDRYFVRERPERKAKK